jgi:cobalt/nickel transport system permease protein
VDWKSAFTAMVGVHLLIGLGEGLITALVFAALQRARPELMQTDASAAKPVSWGEFAFYGLLATLGLGIFVAPLACQWPDGLESVAEKLGFVHAATEPTLPALAPDYAFPGIRFAPLATALAAAVGCVVVFVLALILARILVPKRVEAAPASTAPP